MSDQRTPQPTMAEVLTEHEYDVVIEGVIQPACRCGWVAPSEWESTAVYDQHVAAALAAAGYGHVATVEARAEAAEAQVAAVRRVAEEWDAEADACEYDRSVTWWATAAERIYAALRSDQ